MFQICVMSSFFDTDNIGLWQAGYKTDATFFTNLYYSIKLYSL